MNEAISQPVALKLSDLYRTLSEELAQHGELRLLLEDSQDAILKRSAQRLAENVEIINDHLPKLDGIRRHREDLREELAAGLGQPAGSTFRQLVGLLPAELQSHLVSRVSAINSLLISSQLCLRRNQLLLHRSLEKMDALRLSAPHVPKPGASESLGEGVGDVTRQGAFAAESSRPTG